MSDINQQQVKYSESMMLTHLEEEEHIEPLLVPMDDQTTQLEEHTMAPPKYSSLNKKEKGREKDKYGTMKAANTFVSAKDMNTPIMQKKLAETKKIGGEKMTQQQLMEKALAGDCSNLEKLDMVLRDRAATIYIKDFISKHQGESAEQIVRRIKTENARKEVSAMMNPLLRAGISLIIHSETADDEMKEKYRKLDELLNTEIMKATLTKKVSSMPSEITPEQKKANIESQKFMMKMLLACHIGRLQKKDNGVSSDWSGSVANAFAHCSRVMFIMPGESGASYSSKKRDDMIDAFRGKAGFKRRGGATHNLGLKRKDGTKEAKEKKSFTPFNQWGMNVAVGGLGNDGIPGPKGETRLLKNDGSCGHLYMHLEEGGKKKHAGLLLGFESDQYGHTNQQGHTHDLKATGEKASSFGGQRVDEIGDKYGGREVDLSKVDEKAFTDLMEIVDQVLDRMYNHPGGEYDDDIDKMAEKLCGGLMNERNLTFMIDDLLKIGQRYQIGLGHGAVDLVRGLDKLD